MHRQRLGPAAMALTSYAIALGSNRRGRHGSPADDGARRGRGDRGGAALDGAARLRRWARPGAASPTPSPSSRSELDPPALLARLKQVERDFGRRGGRRWGPRVLDLDIILWSQGRLGRRRPHRPPSRIPPPPLRARAAGRDRPALARPDHRRHRPPAPFRLAAAQPSSRRSRDPGQEVFAPEVPASPG